MSAELKIEKPTIYYRSANVAELIKPFEKAELDFKIKKTGYSCQIVTPNEKILISASRASRRLFASYKKLAAEIDRAPHVDSIPRNQIKYYEFSEKYSTGSHSFRKAWCVDIKSAYLSCLRVNQVISEPMFIQLSKLRKIDRLKSVGMLATKQIIFEYKAGKLIDFDIEFNAHRRSYFMLVCYEIGRLMEAIEKATGDSFLFFWVDGLYFRTLKAANIAKEILSNAGYRYSFDKLENLWIHNRSRHAYIDFQKDNEFKAFRVSKKSTTFETDRSVAALIRSAEKTIKRNTQTK